MPILQFYAHGDCPGSQVSTRPSISMSKLSDVSQIHRSERARWSSRHSTLDDIAVHNLDSRRIFRVLLAFVKFIPYSVSVA